MRSAPSRFGISTDLHCSVRYAVGVRWLRHLTRRQKPFRTSDVARKSHSVDSCFAAIRLGKDPSPAFFIQAQARMSIGRTNGFLSGNTGSREPASHKTTLTNLKDIAARSPSTPFGYRYWRPSGLLWHTLRLDLSCNRRSWSVTTSPHTLLSSLCSSPRTFMSGSVRHCPKEKTGSFYSDVV